MTELESSELRAMLITLRSLQAAVESPWVSARESNQRTEQAMLACLAGENAADLLASPENARKYLAHSSWKLRLAAIDALGSVWSPGEDFAATCERIAFSDPHDQVRGFAIYALARCLAGTNDPRAGGILRSVVYNSALPANMRESANLGLYVLRGMPHTAWPLPGKFRFPEEVDWTFVDSFV